VTGQADQADREVAQAGHDLGPEAARMRLVSSAKVTSRTRWSASTWRWRGPGHRAVAGWRGERLAAERLDEFGARVAAGQVGGVPLHDDDLLGMREIQVGWDRRGLVGWGIPPRPPRCATNT
jgi:hypothetical protein